MPPAPSLCRGARSVHESPLRAPTVTAALTLRNYSHDSCRNPSSSWQASTAAHRGAHHRRVIGSEFTTAPPRSSAATSGIKVDTLSDEIRLLSPTSFDSVRRSHAPGGSAVLAPPCTLASLPFAHSWPHPAIRQHPIGCPQPSSDALISTLSCWQQRIYRPKGRPDGSCAAHGAALPLCRAV